MHVCKCRPQTNAAPLSMLETINAAVFTQGNKVCMHACVCERHLHTHIHIFKLQPLHSLVNSAIVRASDGKIVH